MAALLFELFPHNFLHRGIRNDCLFRSADRAVVETFTGKNVLHRLGNVRGAFNKNRDVAGANPKRRLAGRISSAHQSDAASRQDDGSLLVLH